jgi:hypothetical protein
MKSYLNFYELTEFVLFHHGTEEDIAVFRQMRYTQGLVNQALFGSWAYLTKVKSAISAF